MAPKLQMNGRTFSGMVGATMAALKFKDHFDGYNRVAVDEEGKHSPTSAGYRDREHGIQALEEEEGLLNPDIQKPIRKKSSSFCVCCGLNCGLFWKAVGIVAAIFLVISAARLIFWALSPSPTGIEGMPAFSESLGCLDATYLYNGGDMSISIPVGPRDDHAVDVYGATVGTFTVTEAPADITEVQYKVTIKSNDPSLLDSISLQYPSARSDGVLDGVSRLLIRTPHLDKNSDFCIRHDVIMYVPKNLKKLHIVSHSTSQVKFDPHAHLELDNIFVTLFSLDRRNMVLPSENILATKLALEMTRGWIVGHLSIVSTMSLTSQRGDGVINVHLHPTAPVDPLNPDPVSLRTTTGAGRTDVYYISDKAFPHRPIKSAHISAKNADVHLTYKEAEFEGNVKLDSGSYSVTGAHSYSVEDGKTNGKWTHWAGDKNGKDEILVNSRGWTGLHF
ncbi:hypothetical protein GYMLUDRAFT_69274 [Collybiopsis luxurians FD-317 M1]|nr:hypothetical protein GYMLUDRAFT_69274 [Collybiopsis luxurians FD-317 M1]